jgi:glucokinase
MTGVGSPDAKIACLALDIGASKADCAVVDGDATISHRERILVREQGDHLFEAIVDLVSRVRGSTSRAVLGVGCAGPMTRGGELVSPLNIPAWRDFALRARLEQALGLRVYVDGDARALALAEGTFGGARDDDSYVSMVVSTGIGGAIVLDGRLLDGETGNAGHIGHLNVVPNGRLCACGSYGCLEAEASGRAIEDVTGRPAAEADQSVRTRCGELVGRAVGSLASVLDFSHCYVAGSVALGFGDEFFEQANKSARAVAMMHYSSDVEIRRSPLGSNGPILGAALVGWRGDQS